jgi:hypothetical protein
MSRFDFPNLCCRCAAPEPMCAWDVQSEDRKLGAANALVTVTTTISVPVCTRCRRVLCLLLAICWFCGLTVGGSAGWYLYDWSLHRPHAGSVPPAVMVGMPILLGILLAAGTAWLLKAIFINYDFVYYDPRQGTLVFKNRQCQERFDALNNPSVGRSWSAG